MDESKAQPQPEQVPEPGEIVAPDCEAETASPRLPLLTLVPVDDECVSATVPPVAFVYDDGVKARVEKAYRKMMDVYRIVVEMVEVDWASTTEIKEGRMFKFHKLSQHDGQIADDCTASLLINGDAGRVDAVHDMHATIVGIHQRSAARFTTRLQDRVVEGMQERRRDFKRLKIKMDEARSALLDVPPPLPKKQKQSGDAGM